MASITPVSWHTNEVVNRFYPIKDFEIDSFTTKFSILIRDCKYTAHFPERRLFIMPQRGDRYDAEEAGLHLFGRDMLVRDLGPEPLPGETIRELTLTVLDKYNEDVARTYKAAIRCEVVDGKEYVVDAVELTEGYARAISDCLRTMKGLQINPNRWRMTPVEKQAADRRYRPPKVPSFIEGVPADVIELLDKGVDYLPDLVDAFDPAALTEKKLASLGKKRTADRASFDCRSSWAELFYLFPIDERDKFLYDRCIREMVKAIECKCAAYYWNDGLKPGALRKKGFPRGENVADYIKENKDLWRYERYSSPYVYDEIGDKLKLIRYRTGMNMNEFAAYLEVDRREYSDAEFYIRRETPPNPWIVRRIVDEFGANPEWIFDADRSREGWKLIYEFGDIAAGKDPEDTIPRFVDCEIEESVYNGYFRKERILPDWRL